MGEKTVQFDAHEGACYAFAERPKEHYLEKSLKKILMKG
jgi:hypothetical protein